MTNKNNFTVYRKYEGDRKYYDYNFDQIKKHILEVAVNFGKENKIGDYLDDIENIVEQMVEKIENTTSELKNYIQSYENLELDYNYLNNECEALEERYNKVYEKYCDLIDKAIYGEDEED